MKITIEFIEHEDQRYDTPGDWFFTPSHDMVLRVSKMGDRRYEYLTAIHELVEVLLCSVEGITQKEVDKFDVQWKPRSLPDGTKITEAGEDPLAPYHEQHVIAELVERTVAAAMAVHWPSYGTEVDSLSTAR